jgi:hypothetical protein
MLSQKFNLAWQSKAARIQIKAHIDFRRTAYKDAAHEPLHPCKILALYRRALIGLSLELGAWSSSEPHDFGDGGFGPCGRKPGRTLRQCRKDGTAPDRLSWLHSQPPFLSKGQSNRNSYAHVQLIKVSVNYHRLPVAFFGWL